MYRSQNLKFTGNTKQSILQKTTATIILKRHQRSLIAKLRLGVLPINVEIGRYSNTPRDERYCPLCNKLEVEDEYHIFFKCQHYSELRKELIDFAINTIDNFGGLNESMKLGILSTSY